MNNKQIEDIAGKLEQDHYDVYRELADGGFFKQEEPDNKTLSPSISSITLRSLGMYATERLNINLYYLFNAVDTLIPVVGEAWIDNQLKKRGKNWDSIKEDFKILRKNIYKMKSFYDHLESQKFKQTKNIKTTQAEIEECFLRTSKRISLLQPMLYELLILLIENTSLKSKKMPSQNFKILEHTGMMKLPLNKKSEPTSGISEIGTS